jgi:hypothetical protein
MKSAEDHMTPEQLARFRARVARERAKPPTNDVVCAYCEQFIVSFETADTPSVELLLAAGRVPVPNFGWFCCHACADAYERDYGIRFQRDRSGRVSY